MNQPQLTEAPSRAGEYYSGSDATAGRRQWAIAVSLAFIGSLCLYWRTMAPTIYTLDSAELTTAAATGGLVHATGYPLYLLIGRVWSLLPVGDVGYRMNLLSAFCGALTVALVVQLLRRLGVGPWAALCAAGLLASTRFFWAMALVAEVYTLHTAMMCGVLLALLSWADNPSPFRLGLAAGLLGLAAGNHASSVLLAPGCLFFVLVHDWREGLKPAAIASAACGLLLGLSVYLYLPYLYLQQPQFNYLTSFDGSGQEIPFDLANVKELLWVVAGGPFSDLFFADGKREMMAKTGGLLLELWRMSFGIALGPALLGIWFAFRRSRALGGMLALMALANAVFFVTYAAADYDTMFLPIYVVWAIWIGLGAQLILSLAYESRGWVGGTCLTVVLAGTVAFSSTWSFHLVDLSDDWSVRERGEDILEALDTDAVFLGSWATAPLIEYLQLVEGQRPDVRVINRYHSRRLDIADFIAAEVDRRPLFSDSAAIYGLKDLQARPQGPVFRIDRPRNGSR